MSLWNGEQSKLAFYPYRQRWELSLGQAVELRCYRILLTVETDALRCSVATQPRHADPTFPFYWLRSPS